MIEGDRVVSKWDIPLPDGSRREGVVIAVQHDGMNQLVRVRYDGVYYVNVSECVGGVNPASQFVNWELEEDMRCV